MQINTKGMVGKRYFSDDLIDLTQEQDEFGIVTLLMFLTKLFKKLITHLS